MRAATANPASVPSPITWAISSYGPADTDNHRQIVLDRRTETRGRTNVLTDHPALHVLIPCRQTGTQTDREGHTHRQAYMERYIDAY